MTAQHYVDIGDCRLFYRDTATGQPVVLLHGFSLDHRIWQRQVSVLARRFRVVRYDLRGFGRSDTPSESGYSHADDLKALLEKLGIDRAHIVGLSMGGGAALDFAISYPNALGKLVLADATVGGHRWSDEWTALARPVWKAGREGDMAEAKRLWLEHPLFQHALRSAAAAPILQGIIAGYSGWHWAHRDPERQLEPPAVERLDAIKAPTLVVVGERDLPDFLTVARKLSSGIPEAHEATLADTGHLTNLEAPQQFNELLMQHLGN